MQLDLKMEISEHDPFKPFLRWAGGKRWFLKHLDTIAPNISFNNYHEPFLGSAALFLFLKPKNISYLSDLNSELIETYNAVKENVYKVIEELRKLKNVEGEYYRIRDSRFRTDYKRAARFIYLNQTSFNGIYRVNSEGNYNVPYGYRKTLLFEYENLKLVSSALKTSIIKDDDFESCKKVIKENDLIFLDPPYTVTHNNNGFIKYNQKLFSLDDQYRLSSLIDFIKAKGAYYILTNAAHEKVRQIFTKEGDKIIEVARASLIGGKNAQRGKFSELIITNIK